MIQMGLSAEHILLIAFVVLLLFGGKKIPELMRGLGKGIREFNDAKQSVKSEIEAGVQGQHNPPPPPPPQAQVQNSSNTASSTTTTTNQ